MLKIDDRGLKLNVELWHSCVIQRVPMKTPAESSQHASPHEVECVPPEAVIKHVIFPDQVIPRNVLLES